jgi:hypothetical protein
MTIAELLGVDLSEIMRELLERAKLDVLFEAQHIGLNEPSAATAGTMLYAASVLADIRDEELEPYFAELGGLLSDTGTIDIPERYRTTVEANWSDGWCLAALLQRPHLAAPGVVERLALSFFRRQDGSGGWGLRPDRPGRPHPLFCLPAVLAIRAFGKPGAGPPGGLARTVAASRRNLLVYLRRPSADAPLVELLREAELKLLGEPSPPNRIEELHGKVWRGGRLLMESVWLGREEQPLWYTMIDRSLMMLATRHLWPVLDPVNIQLSSELLDNFDAEGRGWRNNVTDTSICTWRTAEAILGMRLLDLDLKHAELTVKAWQAAAGNHAGASPGGRLRRRNIVLLQAAGNRREDQEKAPRLRAHRLL